METEGVEPQSANNYLDAALFNIDSAIRDRYGSTEVTSPISGSQTRETREYALQYAIARAAISRFEVFFDSGELRNDNLKDAIEWEETVRHATELGDWSLLKRKLGSHAAYLREGSIKEPGLKKDADAFTNLTSSLGA